MKKGKNKKGLSKVARIVVLAIYFLVLVVFPMCIERGLIPLESDSVIAEIYSYFPDWHLTAIGFVIVFVLISLISLINKWNAKRIDNQNENIRTEQIEYFKKLLDEGVITKEEFAEKEKSIKSQPTNKQKRK